MGLKKPVFEEFGDGIKVIIFRNPLIQDVDKPLDSVCNLAEDSGKIDLRVSDMAGTDCKHFLDGGNVAVIGGNNNQCGGNMAVIGGNHITDDGHADPVRENQQEYVDVTTVIMQTMKNHPHITLKKIAEEYSIPLRTVERTVRKLRESRKVIRYGATHGGFWQVVGE
jgi:hypothetical protein